MEGETITIDLAPDEWMYLLHFLDEARSGVREHLAHEKVTDLLGGDHSRLSTEVPVLEHELGIIESLVAKIAEAI